jgi:hypothetical protein
MEDTMCYERKSYLSAGKAKEADRQRELGAKRAETIDTLLREADKAAQTTTPEATPVKEAAPAK